MNNFKFRAYYKPHLDKGIVEMFEQVERDNKLYFVSSLNNEVIYDFYIPFIDDDWLVEQALNRDEPMKPTKDGEHHRCPKCAHIVDNHYCSDCGQALDWSDEK